MASRCSSPAPSSCTSPNAIPACCLPTLPPARAIAWLFAALCTVEPPIVEREQAPYLERDQPWFAARLPLLDERIRVRLRQLAGYLGERPWLAAGSAWAT